MYKYTILEKLRKLSIEDYEIAMKFFPERLKISPWTWQKWIYAKKGDTQEIRPSQLCLIASFFECQVIDLINIADEQKNSLKKDFKQFKIAYAKH